MNLDVELHDVKRDAAGRVVKARPVSVAVVAPEPGDRPPSFSPPPPGWTRRDVATPIAGSPPPEPPR